MTVKGEMMLENGKTMPSVDAWLREAKADASAAGCGMYLTHNGVVRATPKSEVRGIETDGVAPGRRVGGMVFGLPLQMNGEEGEIAAEVRAFAAKMERTFALPVAFWDERLSSSAMESFLIKEVDLSRAKRKKVLDASAAAYILQGFLDALKRV